jgi:hypothetical protein
MRIHCNLNHFHNALLLAHDLQKLDRNAGLVPAGRNKGIV